MISVALWGPTSLIIHDTNMASFIYLSITIVQCKIKLDFFSFSLRYCMGMRFISFNVAQLINQTKTLLYVHETSESLLEDIFFILNNYYHIS